MFPTWLRVVCGRRAEALSPRRRAPGRRGPRLRLEALESRDLLSGGPIWGSYAQAPQHTGVSPVASQSLDVVGWSTPVDLSPQYSGGDLLIHYGSPLVTAANTVIVPVKTGATDGFKVEARSGSDGSLKWTQTTDYRLPPHNWVPSYSPTLTASGRLYYAGAGGTVYYLNAPDATGASVSGQLAFYGLADYTAHSSTYNGAVYINTPITADAAGNIYFGFQVTGTTPANLSSGIARIGADGSGTWVAAATAAGDSSIAKVVLNCAPALSNDGSKVYVAVSTGNFGAGYLLELNSSDLSTAAEVRLKDVLVPTRDATLPDDGSASPTVGPDGDVYFGVLETPTTSSKGWLLHFSGDLSQVKTAGAFGWDDTASVVDASLVSGYTGSSSYLLMTKYNNYAGLGGDGVNKIAILDPNDSQTDSRSGATVMKEVLTIAGQTPDPEFRGPDHPNAVREWCINTAAVDPFTKSVLANSEDGKLYRWDLTTNTFTQVITLTTGIGEAYTPIVVGADGSVYAINNATLFAVRGRVAVANAGFESPSLAAGDFQYNPGGAGWTFSDSSGVASNGSAFTAGNPNAPEGTQVAFLQGGGSISQSLTFAAGTYTIGFSAAQRGNYQDSSQRIAVLIDGVMVDTFSPSGSSYVFHTTDTFSVSAGAHTVTFVGLDQGGGDNTAFIDQVRVYSVS
jgi:hypothetical protein